MHKVKQDRLSGNGTLTIGRDWCIGCGWFCKALWRKGNWFVMNIIRKGQNFVNWWK